MTTIGEYVNYVLWNDNWSSLEYSFTVDNSFTIRTKTERILCLLQRK